MDIYIMSDGEAEDLIMGSGSAKGFLRKPLGRREILSLLGNYPRRSRMMVVDDDEGIRDAICGTISSLGCKPVLCSCGSEAVDAYKGDIPLVLSDFNMPGMNGLELAKKLKEKEGSKV